MQGRSSLVKLTLIFSMAASLGGFCAASQQPPAGDPLSLIEPDALAVLVINQLRDQGRDILNSKLLKNLRSLPAARTWLDSENPDRLQKARIDFEAALGVRVPDLFNEVLGDAVVLSLHVPEGRSLDDARGFLLTWVRNPAILRELIARFNAAEIAEGRLERVENRDHKGRDYSIRQFRPGTKLPEAYTLTQEGWFAWSNSPILVENLIDRLVDGNPGISARAEVVQLRRELPSSALATFYLMPRMIESLAPQLPKLASIKKNSTSQLLLQTVSALDCAGLALEWQDGLILHAHQKLDPTQLPDMINNLALPDQALGTVDTRPNRFLTQLPKTAPAIARFHFNPSAAYDLLRHSVSDSERRRFDHLELFLQGILLGKSWTQEVLPALGPEFVFYLSDTATDARSTKLGLIAATRLSEPSGMETTVADALRNAFQTLLAATALDANEKDPKAEIRIESQALRGEKMLTWKGPDMTLSIAASTDRLVIGTPAEEVARLASTPETVEPNTANPLLGSPWLTRAANFIVVDLNRMTDLAAVNRPALNRLLNANTEKDSDDLDNALALLSLFRLGFATLNLSADLSSAHQSVGLLAR